MNERHQIETNLRTLTIDLDFTQKIHDFFFDANGEWIPSTYKVMWGGRGGLKTFSFSRIAIALAAAMPLRILCAREVMTAIRESVHSSLREQIHLLHLESVYEVQQYSIKSACGSEFIFEGINNNPEGLQSLHGVDICWIEEAANISKRSWEVVPATFIRKGGAEIWVSFNPNLENDATSKRFLGDVLPPRTRIIETNWRDNPWLDEKMLEEKDYLARVDPDSYMHVWEGKCRTTGAAQVLSGKYIIQDFEPTFEFEGPYIGLDFGFAVDPTVMVMVWICDNQLFVQHEAYGGIGVDTDKLPALFRTIPMADKYVVRADSARPETISALQRAGYPKMTAVEKWAGSVPDSIAFLRSFEKIIIRPCCVHTIDEAAKWSYKTDRRSGDILPDLKPGNDHCIADGQLIETARGQVPIEEIVAGDHVLTRGGWRQVVEAWCASPSREIWEVKAAGRTLRATPDHKIWTSRGWMRVDSLRYDDEVIIAESSWESADQKLVHARVEAVYALSENSPVYDLAVADCHEFIASGILVSNCWDAVRYALQPLIKNTGDWNFIGV